jgi:prepilin-type N-terminal cleavage/methylation domain-containing protein
MRVATKSSLIAPREAFTLIELLVVIAILSTLASLIVAVGNSVYHKRDQARVKAELRRIELHINEYKEYFGSYPQSNTNGNFSYINPLFYELGGVELIPNPPPANLANVPWQYRSLSDNSVINANSVVGTFGIDGFQNVKHGPTKAKSFADFKDSQHKTLANALGNYELLVVPVKGTQASSITNNGQVVNPWRYNSINPTNKPGEFDLWAEYNSANKNYTNGNWEKF